MTRNARALFALSRVFLNYCPTAKVSCHSQPPKSSLNYALCLPVMPRTLTPVPASACTLMTTELVLLPCLPIPAANTVTGIPLRQDRLAAMPITKSSFLRVDAQAILHQPYKQFPSRSPH